MTQEKKIDPVWRNHDHWKYFWPRTRRGRDQVKYFPFGPDVVMTDKNSNDFFIQKLAKIDFPRVKKVLTEILEFSCNFLALDFWNHAKVCLFMLRMIHKQRLIINSKTTLKKIPAPHVKGKKSHFSRFLVDYAINTSPLVSRLKYIILSKNSYFSRYRAILPYVVINTPPPPSQVRIIFKGGGGIYH